MRDGPVSDLLLSSDLSDAEFRIVVEDCLRAYCRGVDRLHAPSLRAGFHPGAMLVDYRSEPMTIEAFVEQAIVSLQQKFVATQHRISNITIERVADGAVVETYVHATHVQQRDDGRWLHTFVGRYVDRFEIRHERWKIAHRTLRNDWSNVQPMLEPMSGSYVPSGRGSAETSPDPLWAQPSG